METHATTLLRYKRRMRAHLLLVVALAICACKKDKKSEPGAAPNAPASTADQDALWALAPDKAFVGVVVSPSALARVEAGVVEVNKLFAVAPELAPFKAKIDEALEEVLGTTNPSLAAAGMTSSKGLAVFAVEGIEKPIMILPVGDRDKFLAVAKGQKGTDGDTIKRATCKTVKNVYACARSPELFDRLGKGSLAEQLKLAGARGDIEYAASIPGSPISFGGVAQLARGSVVLRAGVKGVPAEMKKLLANVKPRVDGDKTAGFAVLNIAPYLAAFRDKVPPLPIAPGVTADALVKSVDGPLTMTIENGATVFDLRVPLNDGATAQKLVEQCDQLPPAQQLGATVKDGACHVPVPQLQMELDAWVDGKTLRIGKKGAQGGGPAAPLSPVAKELANGEWLVAMFGRGTMFGQTQMQLPMPPGALPPEAMMGLRAVAMLSELGFGVRVDGEVVRVLATVRTVWSNPADVVAKLVAIDPADILQGKAGAQGKAVADAFPQSAFAGDFKTGISGLMIPTAMVGILAAVAIPAYVNYMTKSKQTEASLMLNRLGKNLKVAFITNGAFPKGTVGPTPAKSCCESQGRCLPDAAAWADPVWQALDFQIDDPHMFRYAYSSQDGKTFVAKAIGDLDCDGKDVEYVMSGSIDDAGNPVLDVVPPQPGDD